MFILKKPYYPHGQEEILSGVDIMDNVSEASALCLQCPGVAAGLAVLWDVHGEVPERKHPASR